MKNKDKELDVDFIGRQKPMTKEEELAISEFIRSERKKKEATKPGEYQTKDFQ